MVKGESFEVRKTGITPDFGQDLIFATQFILLSNEEDVVIKLKIHSGRNIVLSKYLPKS